MACNRSSADFMISTDLIDEEYDRFIVDYSQRFSKDVEKKVDD